MIDAETVRRLFLYDPASGVLTFATGTRKGRQAGSRHHGGYRRVHLADREYFAHRLIWLYVHGEWPEVIDHINHDKADNRIENLRSVTRLENQKNRKISVNNTSGVNGVYWNKPRKRWVAHIKVCGVNKPIGLFHSKDAAIAARASAEVAHGFHPNHGMP